MERIILLYVDVRSNASTATTIGYIGASSFCSTTSKYNSFHSNILDYSLSTMANPRSTSVHSLSKGCVNFRLDKFYLLARRYVGAGFRFLKNNEWSEDL